MKIKFTVLALFCSVLLGCSNALQMDDRYRASGQSSRVQYIVLHYTASDFERSLKLLTEGQVSAHYLLDQGSSTIYRLVDEDQRAWHAGDSAWRGRTWLNASTIGIELINHGFTETSQGRQWQPYDEEQITTLIALLKDIVARHDLPIDSIIGHSDIAPQRKVDPGPLFPWQRLAEEGLISWPEPAALARVQPLFEQALPNALWFQTELNKLGYRIEPTGEFDPQTRNVLAAFQMKYRPARYDGVVDAETAAILAVLNAE